MAAPLETYTIRQVMNITGLSEFTLRGWELRYQAFQPARAENGRRKYSQNDLRKALLLRELLKRGHKISGIAQMDIAKLENLLQSQTALDPAAPEAQAHQESIDRALYYLNVQDWEKLEMLLELATAQLPPKESICSFILPVIHELSSQISQNLISIAQEHILSSLIKAKLFSYCKTRNISSQIRFVIASPEGDLHELGILAAHALALQSGVTSLYLGPNTPKSDLCETAIRYRATHVLLGSTNFAKRLESIYSFLDFLNQHLPEQVVLWTGGSAFTPGLFNYGRRKHFHCNSLLEFDFQVTALANLHRKI